MIRLIAFLILAAVPNLSTLADSEGENVPLRVLMTVGGVGYNTWIVRMLKANRNIEITTRSVDDHPVVFDANVLVGNDATLMYHRDDLAEPEERAALLEYLEGGGGVVVLHHSIANYPGWKRWWRDHVGGLYVRAGHDELPVSRYYPDFYGVALPTSNHPITNRLGAVWRFRDEGYDDLWVSDDISVLLRTTAFGSDGRLAWIGPSNSKRVVYIQPGHNEAVLTDPTYLKLVEDALRWVARDRNW